MARRLSRQGSAYIRKLVGLTPSKQRSGGGRYWVELLEARCVLSANPVLNGLSTNEDLYTSNASIVEAMSPPPPAVNVSQSALQGAGGGLMEVAPFPFEQTFSLNSLPGATKTIYLDFTGHTTRDTDWNSSRGLPNIVTPPYDLDDDPLNFSEEEMLIIQSVWERVSEDFRPFNVNVTTQDPGVEALRRTGAADDTWGIRVAIGGSDNDWFHPAPPLSAGGVAHLNSFTSSIDDPCFVFAGDAPDNIEFITEATSHEVGHTLGLVHDSHKRFYVNISDPDNPETETLFVQYYAGHGTDPTSWAPIMGVGFDSYLTQWSNVEYPNGLNRDADDNPFLQDDLAVITEPDDPETPGLEGNGLSYREDDHGSTVFTAQPLPTVGDLIDLEPDDNGQFFSAEGIIERNTDIDVFSFVVEGLGEILTFDILPFYNGPNLDVLAKILDASGNELYRSNPLDEIAAGTATLDTDSDGGWFQFDAFGNVIDQYIDEISLLPGVYYLTVQGTGRPITFVDPAAHPDPVEWDPESGDPIPPDDSDWGYSNYGSLGYYSISGERKSGLVVGVDFDTESGNSPGGWTRASGGTQLVTLSNLSVETSVQPYSTGSVEVVDGVVTLSGGNWPIWAASKRIFIDGTSYFVASRDSNTQITLSDTTLNVAAGASFEILPGRLTSYDLTIATTGPQLQTVASQAPVDPNQLPDHALPLDELGGYLTASDGEILSFTWSDLAPNTVYNIYVFGHADASIQNEVTVTGGIWNGVTQNYSFTQDVMANGVAVNGDDMPGGEALPTLGLLVISDAFGLITIEVTNALGHIAGIAGVAISTTELGSLSGQIWHDVNGSGGSAEPGEEGLPEWIAYLDLNNNGILDTQTTPPQTINQNAPSVPQFIPDYSTVKNELTVTQSGTIVDVNVTMNISHTFNSDLNVYLVAPDGTRIKLVADRGGNSDNFTNTTFDDSAATSIASIIPSGAPYTGSYRPEQPLSVLNGMNSAGKWTLEISDDAAGSQGTLNGWSISIEIAGTSTYLEPLRYTDSEGNYSFDELKPGVYYVRQHIVDEDFIEGWRSSWAPPPVLVTSRGDIQGVDLGSWIPIFSPGSVAGNLWDDQDGNGERNGGEPGLANWTVFIDANRNGVHDIATTPIVYNATGLPKQIKDFTTVTSSIVVEDVASILDVEVTLDITHSFMADLEAFLTSPSGRVVQLFTGVGAQFNDFTNLTLSDSGERRIDTIGQADLPYTGVWRPEVPLAAFFGDESAGNWTLTIRDTAFADEGTLNSWSLALSSGEIFTTTDEFGNYEFNSVAPGQYRFRQQLNAGWEQTYEPTVFNPGMSNAYNVQVTAGVTATANFGSQFLGPALPGDYNLNNTVDAADYVLFRKLAGSAVSAPFVGPDGDGSGIVDTLDYETWRQHFGESLELGGGGSDVSPAFATVESSNDGVEETVEASPALHVVSSNDGEAIEAYYVVAARSSSSASTTASPGSTTGGGTASLDAAFLALINASERSDSDASNDAVSELLGFDTSDEQQSDVDGVDALFELIGA